MAVPYTSIEQKAPLASGRGDQTIHYARAVERGRIGEGRIIRDLGKISTLSGADFQANAHGLKDMLMYYLSDGYSVQVNALGTFRLSVSSKGVASPDLVVPATFRRTRLLFDPCDDLKQMLTNLEYERLRRADK